MTQDWLDNPAFSALKHGQAGIGHSGELAAAYDPLDDGQRRELEDAARQRAQLVAEHLRRSRAAFAGSRVGAWPPRLGIRETRRVEGLQTLDRADVLEGRTRADEVAVSTWPIELWHDHRRAHFEHPKAPCSIPLGALLEGDIVDRAELFQHPGEALIFELSVRH